MGFFFIVFKERYLINSYLSFVFATITIYLGEKMKCEAEP